MRIMTAPDVHRTAGRLAACLLAAALILSACGDDAEQAETPVTTAAETTEATSAPAETLDTQVPDLCTLFTAEDFQTVTGETAGVPESDAGTGAIRGTCTISAASGFPLVMIAAYNESDRETTLSMVEAEPVEDLDIEAYWDDTLGLVIPLNGKDWYLQVKVTGSDSDREASVRAARIALDRLDG
jgi:hypothetical protein